MAKKVPELQRFRWTIERVEQCRDDYVGACVCCGAEQFECEPDARKLTCEVCERPTVYGVEELVLMGLIDVV